MDNFSLTKHEAKFLDIIKQVKQYSYQHKVLAIWAIDCLNKVLPLFEAKYPKETVLKMAVHTLQRWVNDEIEMWEARKYTYTVLALARDMEKDDKPYSQIVRAASHCLATCHVPIHSERAAMYIVSAIRLINKNKINVETLMIKERLWQLNRLKELMKLCLLTLDLKRK